MIIYRFLDLWLIEEDEKWCCNESIEFTVVNSIYSGQYKCQNECLKEEDCIGISWSYWETNGRLCCLCYDDILYPDLEFGYGFYRKPDGSHYWSKLSLVCYKDLTMSIVR